MKKKKLNEVGSTLVLVVIIMALTTVLGTSILNITMNQYKIIKSNSEIKKSFYVSEDGLNKAYLRVLDLIVEASADSVVKADEYLNDSLDDYSGASDIFKNNYQIYILSNMVNRVNHNDNPYIEVLNKSNMVFVSGKLTVRIKSKYLSESGIEKSSSADIIILIPDYIDTKAGTINYFSLICFGRFDL
jgi:hypothetical protein